MQGGGVKLCKPCLGDSKNSFMFHLFDFFLFFLLLFLLCFGNKMYYSSPAKILHHSIKCQQSDHASVLSHGGKDRAPAFKMLSLSFMSHLCTTLSTETDWICPFSVVNISWWGAASLIIAGCRCRSSKGTEGPLTGSQNRTKGGGGGTGRIADRLCCTLSLSSVLDIGYFKPTSSFSQNVFLFIHMKSLRVWNQFFIHVHTYSGVCVCACRSHHISVY